MFLEIVKGGLTGMGKMDKLGKFCETKELTKRADSASLNFNIGKSKLNK
jgi:hypothetical protein